MTDRELLELLLNKVTSMESKMGTIETDIKDMKVDLKSVNEQTVILTEFREETSNNFNKLENKLDDIEVNNADRHILIGGELKKIKAGLSKVEIITADNWGDIARLKAIKRHRIK